MAEEKPKKRKKSKEAEAREKRAREEMEAGRRWRAEGAGRREFGPARRRSRPAFGIGEPEEISEEGTKEEKKGREEAQKQAEKPEEKKPEEKKPKEEPETKKPEEEGETPEAEAPAPPEEAMPSVPREAAEKAGEKGKELAERGIKEGGKKALKKTGEKAVKEAGKQAVKQAGKQAVKLAAKEGIKAAAGAATQPETWPVILGIIAWVLMFLVGVACAIAIIAIFAIYSKPGRSAVELPNENLQADMVERGKAIANAGGGAGDLVQAKGMQGDESFNKTKEEIADTLGENVSQSKIPLINKAFAQSKSISSDKLNSLKTHYQELATNLEAMQAGSNDDIFVVEETERIQLITAAMKNDLSTCTENNEECTELKADLDKMDEIINEIKNYTFTTKEATMAGEAYIKTESGIEINPLDLQYIKDNKIDIRILRLINHLGEAGWDRLKISRIVQFDPEDDESNVETEDERTVSAHNTGQALDISVVGTYKCKKKSITGSKTYKMPCYVYYQTGASPDMLLPYGNPRGDTFDAIFGNMGFDEAERMLELREFEGDSFTDLMVQAGLSAILEKTGFSPIIFELPENDHGFGEVAFAEAFGLRPESFDRIMEAQNSEDGLKILGAEILAQKLDRPSGTFIGNSSEEILENAARAYLRKALGVSRTSYGGRMDYRGIGIALLESALFTRDEARIKEKLSLSQNIVNKSLDLSSDTTNKFLSGEYNFNQFTEEIGKNEINKISKTYQGVGRERALGIASGSLDLILANDNNTLRKVGAATLARSMMMDEDNAYNNPGTFIAAVDHEAILDFNVLNQEKMAKVLKGGYEGEEELKLIASEFLQEKSKQNINSAIVSGLRRLNYSPGLDSAQIKNLLTDPEFLKKVILETNSSILDNSIYSYYAQFGNYTMTDDDIGRLRAGDYSTVAMRVGGAVFENELNFPRGFISSIVEGDYKDSLVKGGIALLAQALGVNLADVALSEDFYTPGKIPDIFAEKKIEARGFEAGSFTGSINEVIAKNELVRVAASFALSEEEFGVVKNGGIDDYIKSKLYLVDSSIGVPNGSSYEFITGQISADQLTERSSQNMVSVITSAGIAGIARQFGLDESHLPSGDLAGAILGSDRNAIQQFFSSLADSYINQKLLNRNGFFEEMVAQNSIDVKSILTREGIRIFSELINTRAPKEIENIFIDAYMQGGNAGFYSGGFFPANYLREGTGITNNKDLGDFILGRAQTAISHWGVGQLTQAVNQVFGNIGIDYNEARLMITGDKAAAQAAFDVELARSGNRSAANDAYRRALNNSRTQVGKNVGYAYLDLQFNRVDPNIPYGTSRILIEGTNEEREAFALSFFEEKIEINGQPLPPGTLQSVVRYFQGEDIDLEPTALAIADQQLGLPAGTTATIQSFIENNGEFGFNLDNLDVWAANSINGFFVDEFGFDINKIIDLEASIASGQIIVASDPYTLLAQIALGAFGEQIDSAIGIPGFTNGVVVGLLTGNWLPLAFAVISKIFGFSISCQDPVKITREHVRLTLGQMLNAPNTPNQIATYREEDINYYSGLKDSGEIDPRLENTLYTKYGPPETRLFQGMFTLPWAYDHIHAGY